VSVRKAIPAMDADRRERMPHPRAADAHPLLRRLFAALYEERLSWLLLRAPADLAAPSGDVDLLVAREDCDALIELARRLGFVALPGWDTAPDLLLVCYDRPSDRWLVLDVATTIAFRSAGWQSEEAARQVLRRRRWRHELATPAAGDAFWLLLLHCLLDKDCIAPHYRLRLAALAPHAAHSVVATAVLSSLDDGVTARGVIDAVVQGRWATLEQHGGALRAELRRARPLSDRIAAFARRMRAVARRVPAVRRRRGVSVALLGPNGVGKSTLAAGLRDSFPLGARIVYMGVWKAGATTFAGPLVRPLRIWRRYLLARYHQARGRLVVFDRYVYEAALPPHPPFRRLKRVYHWLLRHAVPMPDVVVLLDVAGSVAYRRKQENPPDELERERRVYRGLASSVPALALVDASQDAAAVRADVTAIVWRRSAARWRRDGDVAATGDPRPPTIVPSLDQRLAGRAAPRRAELAQACALVPRVLASEGTFLPRAVARACIAGAQLTSTRMSVVSLAAAAGGEPPCAVVKLPMTPAGAAELERESDVLDELHTDARLADWRRLLPQPLAAGIVLGQPYRIDSFIRGRELVGLLTDPTRRDALLETAAETIHVLHRSTAVTVTGDVADAERWVDARLADLSDAGARRDPGFAPRAEALRAELRDATIGRTLTTGWTHGDYWLGNVLFSADGASVRGVVDWDGADPADLPLHDLLHLVMYTRRLIGGQGLGQIVREQLRTPRLSAPERVLLERYVGWPPGGLPSYRHALLLYWLRHVALHARQHGSSADWRYRLWEQRNVHAVMRAL
jgi:hypothetical protein